MVNISKLQIDSLAQQIDVEISTDTGNVFTKVYAWKAENFKDYDKAIDLSFLLEGTTETESFSVFPVEHLWEDTVSGLWFFEFQTDGNPIVDDCNINSNIGLGLVANYIPYFEKITETLLAMSVSGCGPDATPKKDCVECQEGEVNVFYVNTLLSALKFSTAEGYYEEAIKIVGQLDDLLEVCHSCPNYSDTLLINGLGFATINNAITTNFI